MKRLVILFPLLLLMSCNDDSNPCDSVDCANGGECIKGDCNCPKRYAGKECREPKTPRTMTVKKVYAEQYPLETSGGSGWDFFSSFPDMYLVVSSGIDIITSTRYFSEANGSTITYSEEFPISISYPEQKYTISVYDYDSSSEDDFMGSTSFIPFSPLRNQNGNEFSEQITVRSNDFKLELSVAYAF